LARLRRRILTSDRSIHRHLHRLRHSTISPSAAIRCVLHIIERCQLSLTLVSTQGCGAFSPYSLDLVFCDLICIHQVYQDLHGTFLPPGLVHSLINRRSSSAHGWDPVIVCHSPLNSMRSSFNRLIYTGCRHFQLRKIGPALLGVALNGQGQRHHPIHASI
jgi:hypothetical protein